MIRARHSTHWLQSGVLALSLGMPALLLAQPVTFGGIASQVDTGSIVLLGARGVVIAPDGTHYITAYSSNQIVRVDTAGAASVLPVIGAALAGPAGIAMDGQGNLLVVNAGNSTVVRITPAGVASVLDTGALPLNHPSSVAVDGAGNVFIADWGNHRVVRVGTDGAVSEPAIGGMRLPGAVAVDASGNLYVGNDSGVLVKVDPAGVSSVVTITGVTPNGYDGLAIDSDGHLIVANFDRLIEVDTNLVGTDISPKYGVSGPRFAFLALDRYDAISVVNTASNKVQRVQRKVADFGNLAVGATKSLQLRVNLVGNPDLTNLVVSQLGAMGQDFSSGNLTSCVAGTSNPPSCIIDVQLKPAAPGWRSGGMVLTYTSGGETRSLSVPLAGIGEAPLIAATPGVASVLASGSVAMGQPNQVAVNGQGTVFVASAADNQVVSIPLAGQATAVSTGTFPAASAVAGVAVDGNGSLFFTDRGNGLIYQSAYNGVLSQITLTADGQVLSLPTALAWSPSGHVYVADSGNQRIVRFRAPDLVNDTSPSQSLSGTVVATGGHVFGASSIAGIAVDALENVYVADSSANAIVKLTPQGAHSLVVPAGLVLDHPTGVAVDGVGTVYIADSGNHRVVQVTTAGVASVVPIAVATGPGSLGTLTGIAVDKLGNLFVSDGTNSRVVKLDVTGGALSFDGSHAGVPSGDSPRTATVSNLGNQPLNFNAAPTAPAHFAVAPAQSQPCGQTLQPGEACHLNYSFVPTSGGAKTGNSVIASNSLNAANATMAIALSGIAAADGACGTASGVAAIFKPAANLCSSGTASVVTNGSPWSWSCSGSGGGAAASCSAPNGSAVASGGSGSVLGRASVAGGSWAFDQSASGFVSASSATNTLPAGYTFPAGLFRVQLVAGAPGSSATVTLTYSMNFPANAVYYKYGPRTAGGPSQWYPYTDAIISGNTVTLPLTDGQLGDDDLLSNSVIVDPGGPAVPAAAVATPVPTLSEWALAALSMLLAALGWGRMRSTGTRRGPAA
jgi:sugar lactone lactonase YvrE